MGYNYVDVCAAAARRQPELGGRAEADPQDLLRPDAVRAAPGPHHQGHVRPVDGGPPHHHREGCSRSHSSGRRSSRRDVADPGCLSQTPDPG